MEATQAIIKAEPSIMELKFGCRICISGCEYEFIFVCEDKGRYILLTESREYTIVPKPSCTTIIGRDITLEDVLVAMEKKMGMKPINRVGELIELWKLNKSFHEQSNDTKELIGNLLT